MAGEAENTLFDVQAAGDRKLATNAIYKLAASSNKTLESGTKEEMLGTPIQSTGTKFIATQSARDRYHRDQSNVVPGNAFPTTVIQSGTVLATLFFDSSRGYFEAGGVPLGPLEGTSSSSSNVIATQKVLGERV